MEEDFKKIFTFIKSEKLSENERISMRNVLYSVMKENPARPMNANTARYESILSYFSSATLRPVGFAFAFVLIVGVGTSYAAESALPGDPLYAIKVGLTEPVQGALAVSPVAKAQWDTEIISRRLEEAATLAASGHLDDATRGAIEVQIAEKSESVSRNIAKLRGTDEGVVAAAAVESDLEASLVGHERVLTGLSIDLPQEAPAIAPLLHKVRMQSAETNTNRKSAERDVATKSDSTVRAAASTQKKNAEIQVRKIRALANMSPVATTTAEANVSAMHIEDAIEEGERDFQEGRYGEALSTFQATIRAAKAVEVNIDAGERLAPSVSATKLMNYTAPDPTEVERD
jgi:hypothetical protein